MEKKKHFWEKIYNKYHRSQFNRTYHAGTLSMALSFNPSFV